MAAVAPALMLIAFAGPLMAQEPSPPIARQQTAADRPTAYQEIPSPMLLEVSLGATPKRKSVQDVRVWVATETGNYVCQQVRVPLVEVWKEEGQGKVRLRVHAGLLAQDRPKDVDVTVSIVSESKEIRKKLWESFTADPTTRHPRSPEAEFEFTPEEFAGLFGPGRAPRVRVVVEIKE